MTDTRRIIEDAIHDADITLFIAAADRRILADAVLSVVEPVIRRQVAEEIGDAIKAETGAVNWAKTFRNGLDHAAAIARSHAQLEVERD